MKPLEKPELITSPPPHPLEIPADLITFLSAEPPNTNGIILVETGIGNPTATDLVASDFFTKLITLQPDIGIQHVQIQSNGTLSVSTFGDLVTDRPADLKILEVSDIPEKWQAEYLTDIIHILGGDKDQLAAALGIPACPIDLQALLDLSGMSNGSCTRNLSGKDRGNILIFGCRHPSYLTPFQHWSRQIREQISGNGLSMDEMQRNLGTFQLDERTYQFLNYLAGGSPEVARKLARKLANQNSFGLESSVAEAVTSLVLDYIPEANQLADPSLVLFLAVGPREFSLYNLLHYGFFSKDDHKLIESLVGRPSRLLEYYNYGYRVTEIYRGLLLRSLQPDLYRKQAEKWSRYYSTLLKERPELKDHCEDAIKRLEDPLAIIGL